MGERHYCVAPDMVGFGDSSHPENPPSGMKAFNLLQADTLWELLDKLGVDRVHLVGNSMGGMISIRMALAQPERVATMLLMGSAERPTCRSRPASNTCARSTRTPRRSRCAPCSSRSSTTWTR